MSELQASTAGMSDVAETEAEQVVDMLLLLPLWSSLPLSCNSSYLAILSTMQPCTAYLISVQRNCTRQTGTLALYWNVPAPFTSITAIHDAV